MNATIAITGPNGTRQVEVHDQCAAAFHRHRDDEICRACKEILGLTAFALYVQITDEVEIT